jgi:hypothetical protein
MRQLRVYYPDPEGWKLKPYDEPINTIVTPPTETITTGVGIPFLQALIGGFLTGLTVGFGVSFFHMGVNCWAAGFMAGSLFTLVFWLAYRGKWEQRLEKLLGMDLSPVRPAPESIRVEVVENQGQDTTFIDLPHAEKIPALAEGLLNGRTFTTTAWVGSGNLLSRKQWEEIRAELLARGMARWNNEEAHEKGVCLTRKGEAVMREIARRYRPTTGMKALK